MVVDDIDQTRFTMVGTAKKRGKRRRLVRVDSIVLQEKSLLKPPQSHSRVVRVRAKEKKVES